MRSLPAGVSLLSVTAHDDARGRLYAIEQSAPLPFAPVRMFLIRDVPDGQIRARHAVSCHEFLWMLSGSCALTVDDGHLRTILRLGAGESGALVSSGVWMELGEFSGDASLAVFASEVYAQTRYFTEPRRDLIVDFRAPR